jgi:hypothetical protein
VAENDVLARMERGLAAITVLVSVG